MASVRLAIIIIFMGCACGKNSRAKGLSDNGTRIIEYQGATIRFPAHPNESVDALSVNLDDVCIAFAKKKISENASQNNFVVMMISNRTDSERAREKCRETDSIILLLWTEDGRGLYFEQASDRKNWIYLDGLEARLIY